ncbi:DEAD-box ATP-dependent RNA helicase 35A-like [Salvia splendens]|uniref:DEAD-box ATP-dependent RNA helicase 35A-like n=1 Tax=Salvia splendens TaxID=180675 RepID=UPI001C27B6F1|nr:DEAD-box ATP-dependent RNA helicase 35A-like [Salvia splendens]
MIGIAFTGSGKTLVFVLPLVMIALQEEMMMPINPGEGPFGLVVCRSRELARQTFEVVELFLESLKEAGYPELRPLLCIGGIDMKLQLDIVKKGVHIVVATPGRLKDMLAKKKMNVNNCRYLTLDEADRLVDLGFEDDIREPPRGPDENSDADGDPEEDFGGEDEKHSKVLKAEVKKSRESQSESDVSASESDDSRSKKGRKSVSGKKSRRSPSLFESGSESASECR